MVCNSKQMKQTLWSYVKIYPNVALAWNVEDLMPPTEKCIFKFNSKEELKKWHLYSDSEYGGTSIVHLATPSRKQLRNHLPVKIFCTWMKCGLFLTFFSLFLHTFSIIDQFKHVNTNKVNIVAKSLSLK